MEQEEAKGLKGCGGVGETGIVAKDLATMGDLDGTRDNNSSSG